MGRALARLMVEKGHDLFLLGRNVADLEKSARDLEVRGNRGPVRMASCDLMRPETFLPALEAAEAALGGLDAVVVTAGAFATQDRLEADPDLARRVLEADLDLAARVLQANFANTVLFCEHARRRLLARGGGTLCVFSSVAGERGRKPVVLYGAAKAGLSRYLEGLDHRYRAQGLRTVCVKPGFVRTTMTDGLPVPPFAGDPDAVAPRVLRAIERGTPVVYVPPIWRWVMLVIRALPRGVMRRVQF